ncbi:Putative GPI-GalNAc transferase PGAP4 [Septoria linicola]|uniref:GPI-GalNAc transferase PGAP4 n=1 Tax=Septoria linicola TaxID=215465 RepID=A0A9Q9AJT7_9PEZI|nr:Putative GPI-GalNAc transferase PGAP4 [Septoria linicola]
MARKGARYLRTTVGSLLAGLTQAERDGIHMIVFIPHTDPTVHPAYNESWLPNLVDEVLLYNLSRLELDHVKDLESDSGLHRKKGLFDYTYLLKACYSKGTSYIAMIEDDVISMDGWYHRTMAGLKEARARSAQDFLYLRMFPTEEYLGWNSEDWRTHMFWSLMAIVGAALFLFTLRTMLPSVQLFLTPYVSLAICAILVPWIVVLVFAAGKVTVFPLPVGITEMNKCGCCAQGLVYPHAKVPDLVKWFESARIGFADMLTEQSANDHGEQRYALVPSVLQHIGSKSSKMDDFGHGAKYSKSVAEFMWNFGFELNDAKALRAEHELAAVTSAGFMN